MSFGVCVYEADMWPDYSRRRLAMSVSLKGSNSVSVCVCMFVCAIEANNVLFVRLCLLCV